MFVDIHSQHQTYTFLQPQYHINLLDSYAKDFYGNTLENYKVRFIDYENLVKRLEQAKNSSNATESQIDFLKFQINEIEEANIQSPTEDEELTRELEVLENAENCSAHSARYTVSTDPCEFHCVPPSRPRCLAPACHW
jgi:DNA repair protein RecN (Recombination protein N)